VVSEEAVVLTDTHCHLDFEAFDSDREQVLERARQAGVARIMNPGIDLQSSKAALQLAENNAEVFAAVGVHPNSATTFNDRTLLQQLSELAAHPKVVAIGEIGLDYYRDRAPREVQLRVFRLQLELASESGLPVIIHNRQATEDVLSILLEWHTQLISISSPLARSPGVLHSYSDNEKNGLKAIAMNFFIGITGPVTFQNARTLQRVVSALPVANLLIETDAPFLTPHPRRGQRNEPAMVRQVAEKIAELHSSTVTEIAARTTENADGLFNWRVTA
jgi:TatD DNase family protein